MFARLLINPSSFKRSNEAGRGFKDQRADMNCRRLSHPCQENGEVEAAEGRSDCPRGIQTFLNSTSMTPPKHHQNFICIFISFYTEAQKS